MSNVIMNAYKLSKSINGKTSDRYYIDFDDAFCKAADIEAGLLNEGYVIAEGNGISKENMTRKYVQECEHGTHEVVVSNQM